MIIYFLAGVNSCDRSIKQGVSRKINVVEKKDLSNYRELVKRNWRDTENKVLFIGMQQCIPIVMTYFKKEIE